MWLIMSIWVEDDTGIEDVEGGVVKGTCQDNVLEKLQTIGMVDFCAEWRVER